MTNPTSKAASGFCRPLPPFAMSRGEAMRTRSKIFSFGCLPRRFADDSRGLAATEFAIIFPLIVAVAFGAAEICNALTIDRKLTLTARAVSDIVSQGTAVSDTEMANILKTGKTLLQPYSDSDLKLRVSAVDVDADGKATVVWSDASPASEARPKGAVSIPDGAAHPQHPAHLGRSCL